MIAVSYDSRETLRTFAEKYNITYPLLSDEGSEVIKRYGLLNTETEPGSRAFGIPYPGLFVIDKNLTVVSKQFEKSYRDRPTAENVLVNLLDEELQDNVKTFETSYMQGFIGISDTVAYRSQLLAVVININMKDNFHFYGLPIPEGFIPFQVTFEENPNFTVDEIEFPGRTPFTIEGLDETFHVLPEKLDLRTIIRIVNRPEAGNYTVNVKFSMQACNDKVCLPPADMKFEFPLKIVNQRL